MGTAAEMMLMPYGSLIVGFICGIVSTLGFVYLTVRVPGWGLGHARVSVFLTMGIPRKGMGGGLENPGSLCIWGSPKLWPPRAPATAAGLSSTHLPSPAIPGVQATHPGHVWHTQPARHSRHHRRHCGCRDGGLCQQRSVWTARVSMAVAPLFPSLFLPAANPLGSMTVSVPQPHPSLDHCFMGLSPQPPSFHKSLKPSNLFDAPVLQMGRPRPRSY